ncbi:hypothetical protein MHM84_17790 [Halomonas sp. McH1-25]|uniref:hypothetical protein n=1 Tax=unclassified Halomonas TaxID=2609666 RepID=UPI001EF5F5F1|nr:MULTISPECIES: hypothetical protein [unclassified Halomonas]MCG7601622.1 hypothetical protein [Halomonas sp. McH1-25]MCP1342257.1 hypothetical protein [Halomonas sp. FL8]MCP1360526.1 hypothetical protein [Halomonas sp. BBD45]
MMRWLWRGLAAASVALIFLVTLALYWPLPVLASWVKDDGGIGIGWQGVEGRLLDGHIERLSFAPQGAFPLAVGPVNWQVTWPGRLDLTLGEPARAWTLTASLDGMAVDWQLEGGSLQAIDTSQLPLSPAGDWLGKLVVTTQGQRCIRAQGGLTSNALRLLTPDPVSLGQARLTLGCDDDGYRWQLTMNDPPGLELTGTLAMAASGGARGELTGRLAQDHPLATWRRLLEPNATDDTLHREFGW